MLDRIDIHIEVPRVDYEKLSDDRLGEPSANVQARVEAAREIQRQRFGKSALARNADKSGKEHRCPAKVREFCPLDETSNSLAVAQTSFAFAMNQMPAVFRGAFGAGLSPGAQAGAHDCRFSRGEEDRAYPSGGGASVPA